MSRQVFKTKQTARKSLVVGKSPRGPLARAGSSSGSGSEDDYDMNDEEDLAERAAGVDEFSGDEVDEGYAAAHHELMEACTRTGDVDAVKRSLSNVAGGHEDPDEWATSLSEQVPKSTCQPLKITLAVRPLF